MNNYYTNEKNIQIIISLLKKYGIKKIIVSPGTTNISFVGSIQNDSYFELYSSIDERSAAYMACGMAAESREPVVLTCTGATASRNYIPGLTEAYYRKLPVLALTATQHMGRIGQNIAQVIDRRVSQNDICKLNVQVSMIHTEEDERSCTILVNQALTALNSNGGGPVILNYETNYSSDFSVKQLPESLMIKKYKNNSKDIPPLNNKKVAIFIGAHLKMNKELTEAIDLFCEKYNSLVICDQTSNYRGKYGISGALLCTQTSYSFDENKFDILLDMGDISGAYFDIKANEIWRINPDGEIRGRGKKVSSVFEMEEIEFFSIYNSLSNNKSTSNYAKWLSADNDIRKNINLDNIPFSNVWMAQKTFSHIPKDSIVHFGILNTLRSWNYNKLLTNDSAYCNTGGFGIDGILSTLIGASLVNRNKLHIGILGDLAFFYDMNALGNREIGNNIRIIVINNGRGQEFRNYDNRGQAVFGEETDKYIAAAGHYGNKSTKLIKNYVEALGFDYLSANNKENYESVLDNFFIDDGNSKVLEVFTDTNDENKALIEIRKCKTNLNGDIKEKVKNAIGRNNVNKIKHFLKK